MAHLSNNHPITHNGTLLVITGNVRGNVGPSKAADPEGAERALGAGCSVTGSGLPHRYVRNVLRLGLERVKALYLPSSPPPCAGLVFAGARKSFPETVFLSPQNATPRSLGCAGMACHAGKLDLEGPKNPLSPLSRRQGIFQTSLLRGSGFFYGLLVLLVWVSAGFTAGAQTYYNTGMYVAPGTSMADLGTDVIFGAASAVEIQGDMDILSNRVYLAPTAGINGTGNFVLLNPGLASLPWASHTLDANGAVMGANITLNTGTVSLGNLSYSGLTPSTSFDAGVSAQVQFTAGVLVTGSGLFHFLPGSSHTGSSAASHVNGNVRKTGNTAFVFPLGDGSVYAPAGISAPSNPTDHFTAHYLRTDPHAISSDIDPTLELISSCEYWELDRTGGSSSAYVSLSWDDTRSCGVTDPSLLQVARYNGTYWANEGNMGFTGAAGSGSLTSNLVSSFSPFTLSSTSIVNPLPVTLDYFTVECTDGQWASLKWRTLNEQNSAFFRVEYSSDLYVWETVDVLVAAGNSNQPLEYISTQPVLGRNKGYYRLRQEDYDGKFKWYGPIAISCEIPTEPAVFPNPLQAETFYLSLPASDAGWEYTVHDARGVQCLSGKLSGPAGNYPVDASTLHFGTYFVTLRSAEKVWTYRLIKIR